MPTHRAHDAATVAEFVTHSPVVVPPEAPLEHARQRMLANGFRHVLVGTPDHPFAVVSLHDLHYAIGIEGRAPERDAVGAIAVPLRRFPPSTSLAAVARVMAEERLGAVLVQGDGVFGVFTAVDALRALATIELPRVEGALH